MYGLTMPTPPSLNTQEMAEAFQSAARQEFIRDYVLSTVRGQGGLTRTQVRIIRDNASDMYDIMYARPQEARFI